MKKFDTTMYFITDSTGFSEEEFLYRVEEALKGGATLLQLREKDKSTKEYISLAQKVHKITQQYNVPLIIDDRVDVALATDSEGVHLGKEDMPISTARKLMGKDKIIGATAKTVPWAKEAYEQGADYLGVGAIYPTTTKVKTVLTSVQTLSDICKAVPIPVNAIGGLNKNNVAILEGIDIAGICVVSAIMKSDNPCKETKILLDLAKKLKNNTIYPDSTCTKEQIKTALTIAGSDSGGGAGIQADIKTMTVNGVYAMSAITALTAQNTIGVKAIQEATPQFLKEQIDAVFDDIFPDAVKIGMVSSEELISVIADRLKFHRAKNIVVDPVMVSTSGSSLMKSNAVHTLADKLFPIATLITPNIPEAEVLSGLVIKTADDMLTAAKILSDTYSCAVLLKGGHSTDNANDLLYVKGEYTWFEGKKINTPNTHGTGCTLSSAIASNLAKGHSLEMAVSLAKDYVSSAIASGLNLGKGNGPVNHAYCLRAE